MNVVLTVKDKDRLLHPKMVLNCSRTTIPMELMTKLSCSITNKVKSNDSNPTIRTE